MMLPHCNDITLIVERARRLRPKPETGHALNKPGLPKKGAGRMKTEGRMALGTIADRLGARISHVSNAQQSAQSQVTSFRQISTGVPAQEFVLRRVALRRVELQSVGNTCVGSRGVCKQSVSRRAFPADGSASSPRLVLSHVFACIKAMSAKSKVSRLLGRTARKSSPASVASVPPASSYQASSSQASVHPVPRSASVPRRQLH
jgi:hypothetical protein